VNITAGTRNVNTFIGIIDPGLRIGLEISANAHETNKNKEMNIALNIHS
jgi:hypothetical protein